MANQINETTLADDQTLNFGTSTDFKVKYDAADNRLEVLDSSNTLLARLSTAGNLTLTGTLTASEIASGQWTPTITGTANVASSANAVGYYIRIGSIYVGAVYVEITPTAGSNTATTARISNPITSAMTSARHQIGAGTARRAANNHTPARLYADTTNDIFEVEFGSIDTNAHVVACTFAGIIL